MQPITRYKITWVLAGNWILMLVLASIVFTGIGYGTADMPVAASQIIIALSCSLTGFLLLPAARHFTLWSLLAGAGCFLLMAPYYYDPGHLQAGLRLAIGVCLLVYLPGSLFTLLRATRWDEPAASLMVASLMVACFSAPLWLGPLAESYAASQSTVDTIIALTPLSYLAVLADYDYLRSNWFYQHTPFGTLRYDYPSVIVLTLIYLSLAGILTTTRWLLLRRHPQHPLDYS